MSLTLLLVLELIMCVLGASVHGINLEDADVLLKEAYVCGYSRKPIGASSI